MSPILVNSTIVLAVLALTASTDAALLSRDKERKGAWAYILSLIFCVITLISLVIFYSLSSMRFPLLDMQSSIVWASYAEIAFLVLALVFLLVALLKDLID